MPNDVELYRVYRPEWVTEEVLTPNNTRTSDTMIDTDALARRAMNLFDQRFAGRVHDDNVRTIVAGSGPTVRVSLQIRRPNLKAEFKNEQLATAYVAEHGWTDAVIVARGCKTDHELRNYGVTRLP